MGVKVLFGDGGIPPNMEKFSPAPTVPSIAMPAAIQKDHSPKAKGKPDDVESCKHQQEHNVFKSSRCQLGFLLIVAALALTSIVLFAEQLVVRHLAQHQPLEAEGYGPIREEITVVQLEDWAHRETIQFGDNVVSIRAIENIALPVREDPTPPRVVQTSTARPARTNTLESGDIYWPRSIEAMSPPGLPEIQIQDEMQQIRSKRIAKLDLPDWLHCGREDNRFVTFTDGTNACMRNRKDAKLVQGEVMAFYLARMLGMANTPAVVLSETSSNQWSTKEITALPSTDIVALIQWIPRLTKTVMPEAIVDRLVGSQGPLSATSATGMDPDDLSDLVQWSDLIVFDFLTGNYDRVVSMMDGAESEGDASQLKETVHNLGRSTKTSSLWMLDNESSFLDAYTLMYSPGSQGHKFVRFHARALQTLCLFRRRTVERVEALASSDQPDQLLLEFVRKGEPLFDKLPGLDAAARAQFSIAFASRLRMVAQWFETCREL